MRCIPRLYAQRLVALVATATVSLLSVRALAQQDINPPLPNVMLMVDTSGSMEFMPDGSIPTVCGATNNSSDINRWAALVSVLTGTVENRGCYKQLRSSANFVTEYAIGGVPPYDQLYGLPHHRIVSNGCVAGPGVLPANAYTWPAGAIAYHPYNNIAGSCAAPGFVQYGDGLMDVYRDRLRFGLMTFDTRSNPGTGVGGGNSVDPNTGFSGMWSYYDDWQGGGAPTQGHPPNCVFQMFEVGARNAGAPPWEGRMIGLGRPDAPLTEIQTGNDHIQEALLAMRPYGATPLAGMMEDAYTFFRNDVSNDPVQPAYPFAPPGDPYFGDGCRESYIILLSDGEPNLDLRPFCENGNGVCPFREPHVVAKELSAPANPNLAVKTFTVGFGLSSASGIDCNTIDPATDFNSGGQCDGATGALKACCSLMRIAYEGGTQHAFFADNLTTLKSELSKILELISAASTSRTVPAFASAASTQASNSNAPAVAYEFTTSFRPGVNSLWSGNLERHRWECKLQSGVLVPELQAIDVAKGDNFSENVNTGKLTRPREFMTFVGNTVLSGGISIVDSRGTIRPNLSSNDGLGLYDGSVEQGGLSDIANAMQTSPKAMGLDPMPAACSDPLLAAGSPSNCAYQVMKWELGGNNGGAKPNRQGAEFGAIYHSSPALVGAPRAFIRDPSYARFAEQNASRPVVLYTATTDGQLHAFKVASNDATEVSLLADSLENNELWSFLPPYVLPGLLAQYPISQQILLDGVPVVKDVFFERTLAQAQAGGTAAGVDWHTVLVAGGRGGGGFYYALDVTDPNNPTFLWQIGHVRTSTPMFSSFSRTPAIATIRYDNGSGVKEVGVAILPGGTGTLDPDPTCTRSRITGSTSHIDPSYQPRSNVRCWNDGPGRSLTIVRLDTGEVLMRFQQNNDDGPSVLLPARRKNVKFDAPISSQPVPYPSQVGQIANRIFVGDADGTMWRVDLSDANPSNWEVDLMFDGYPLPGDSYNDGQPIDTTPVVAVDGVGNTVVLFSTGDQETFHATGTMETRIWSITEKPVAVGGKPFSVDANWFIPFTGGKRVTGPIALFDEVAYFSTFEPQVGGSVCNEGFGSLWGVDYLASNPSGGGPRPQPRLAVDPDAIPLTFTDELPQSPGTIVFGVAITQEPACFETTTVNDEFVGSYQAISQSTPPTFTLTYHTGTSGTAAVGSQTKAAKRALPSPKQTTRIDSWASVVE